MTTALNNGTLYATLVRLSSETTAIWGREAVATLAVVLIHIFTYHSVGTQDARLAGYLYSLYCGRHSG